MDAERPFENLQYLLDDATRIVEQYAVKTSECSGCQRKGTVEESRFHRVLEGFKGEMIIRYHCNCCAVDYYG